METNGNFKIVFIVSIILIVCGFCIPSRAGIIYVDDDSTGANNGTSWSDAYNFLQDALAVALSGDEIKVAQGIYKPDLAGGNTAGDRQATFQLINGVTIEGGYAGILESEPDIRDLAKYETILSGDLNGDDGPDYENNSENSCHVVTGSFTDKTAVLDGFTITAGHFRSRDYEEDPEGGIGMRIEAGSPTIQNCLFTGNDSFVDSILLNFNGSSPVLMSCTFSNNYRSANAIDNIASSPTLDYCTFESSRNGIENREGSNPVLNNCTFENNRTAIENRDESNPVITDCVFNNNRYGMENHFGSIVLTNCVFENNNSGAIRNILCDLILTDCVFKNHSSWRGMIDHSGGSLMLSRCNLSGNSGGGVDCFAVNFEAYDCKFNRNEGGIICYNSIVNLSKCSFSGNSARFSGGAIDGHSSDFILNNCIFSGNTTSRGGAIFLSARSNMWLTNCTFSDNEGEYGSAINKTGGQIYLKDCIVWDGENAIYSFITDSTISINYSNIRGGWPGEGNIDVDPLFVAPGYWAHANDLSLVVEPEHPNAVWVEGDYHLQSQAGHWDSQSQSWIQDQATSPCIDAGNPMAPIGLEPFPNGAVYNMGAYGRTIEASKTYFGSPVCDVIIPGDINGDCIVDFKDLEIVVQNWMLKGEDFVNSPPVVKILEPQNGDQIIWRGSTTFRVEATDVDGQVMKVDFYLRYRTESSSMNIGYTDSDGSDGWNWEREWDEHTAYGNWTFQAVATDNEGAITLSEITITLIEP